MKLSMKNILIILILIPCISFSQSWEWTKKYGGSSFDYGKAICTDNFGNCYAAVDSLTVAQILKFNSSGILVWKVSLWLGKVKTIVSDNDEFIYVAGDSSNQSLVAKYDTSGVLIWKINAGAGTCNGMTLDNSGHLFLTGNNSFLKKYDTLGNQIWTANVIGATGNSICTDNIGNCYITGKFLGTALFGTQNVTSLGGYDIFLSKYDSTGNCIWVKRAGGKFSGGYSNDCGYAVTKDNLGNLYFTGSIVDTVDFDSYTFIASSNDIFLAKYDNSGNSIWVKQATGFHDQEGRCINIDNVGNIIIGGSYIPSVNFENITLTGWGSGHYDAFIAKYDNNGNLINLLKGGGSEYNETLNGISIDNLGNTFVIGSYSSTAYFGPDTLTNLLSDIFISKVSLKTSIEEMENKLKVINIYPNPFQNELNISIYDSGKSHVILYDLTSREIYQQEFEKETIINTEQFASGIYLYKIQNENGHRKSGKIIRR